MSILDVGDRKKCGVVEEVQRQTLKWFGHMKQMEKGKMTRRVYVSEIEGGSVRGRPPVKWSDRVKEYVIERVEESLKTLSRNTREYKGSTNSNSTAGSNEAACATSRYNYSVSNLNRDFRCGIHLVSHGRNSS